MLLQNGRLTQQELSMAEPLMRFQLDMEKITATYDARHPSLLCSIFTQPFLLLLL
jgi:hypothetical protein